MKIRLIKIMLTALLIGTIGCQKEEDFLFEEEVTGELSESSQDIQAKSFQEIICQEDQVPPGYRVVRTLFYSDCGFYDYGRHNAKVIEKIRPTISRAGSGCEDHYCIWIVGNNFGSNAYVDIRSVRGANIIATYRGANRRQYVENGQDVITIRLGSSQERDLFKREGLRVFVVDPNTGTYSTGRTVTRPRGIDGDDDIVGDCGGFPCINP